MNCSRLRMRLAALAINEANDAGNGARRQVLGDKDVQTVEKARDHDVFSAQRFDIGDLSRLFRGHAGALPSLANAGAFSKLRLRHSRTIDGDSHSRSLKLILQ